MVSALITTGGLCLPLPHRIKASDEEKHTAELNYPLVEVCESAHRFALIRPEAGGSRKRRTNE